MKKDITALLCFVDDFVRAYNRKLREIPISNGERARCPTRTPGLSAAEILTILLLFQISPAKNFKCSYESCLQSYNNDEFHKLPSYTRFIALKPRVLPELASMLGFLFSSGCDLAYIDSTGLAVCHAKRTRSHKVFAGIAKLGKPTKGWFFGLKLHLIVSAKGALVNVAVTAGNVDDRVPVPKLSKRLSGLLCGDKGYISRDLFAALRSRRIKRITGIKKGIQSFPMDLCEKIILRKRSLAESVIDYLKNTMQLEHIRHRSVIGVSST